MEGSFSLMDRNLTRLRSGQLEMSRCYSLVTGDATQRGLAGQMGF